MKEHSSGCQTINPPESSILCPFSHPASGVHKNAKHRQYLPVHLLCPKPPCSSPYLMVLAIVVNMVFDFLLMTQKWVTAWRKNCIKSSLFISA